MVQNVSKNVKLEILLNLLAKRENHVRGVAEDITTSHATVIRKCSELMRENVLDYKEEGKNKVFFLKKTPQARSCAYMAENYKLMKLLRKYPEMSAVVKDVTKIAAGSELVTMFGSYAKFSAKEDSDIDLFIETKNRKLKEKLKQIDYRINAKTGEFDTKNSLIREIMKNHVIIKGVERFYEKTGFFE